MHGSAAPCALAARAGTEAGGESVEGATRHVRGAYSRSEVEVDGDCDCDEAKGYMDVKLRGR
jgi:hypothetical protein